jgi:hypothetical protein
VKQAVGALSVIVILLMATNLWSWTAHRALRSELTAQEAKMQKLLKVAKAQKAQAISPTAKIVKARANRGDSIRRKKGKGGRTAGASDKRELRDRHRDDVLDDTLDVVAELAEERGWSDDVAADVMAVFEETSGLLSSVRDDVGAGELSMEDGREEMTAIKDGVGDELADILGPDEYRVFRERIWGSGR